MLIPWNDAFIVGVPEIDGQHRELVDLLNRLHTESQDGHHEIAPATFERLEEHAMLHFKVEETLMKMLGYAEYDSHRQDHGELLAQLKILRQQFADGAQRQQVIGRLRDWFLGHIGQRDVELASFLDALSAQAAACQA